MDIKDNMELNNFVHKALTNIINGVEGAQEDIWYGEIIPKKEGKTGEVDIDFEVAVEAKEDKVVVVMPPAPPMPHLSKLRFKIPVRLPVKRKTEMCYQMFKAPYKRLRRNSKKKIEKERTEQANIEQGKAEEKGPNILNYFCEKIRSFLNLNQKEDETKNSGKTERQERPYRG